MDKCGDTIPYKKRRLIVRCHRNIATSEKLRKRMARICFVFLVIAAAVLLVDSKSTCKCPKNEEWKECGTACEPTCEKPNPEICTLQCVIGCQCKSGFLRNKNGQCVKKCQCPKN